MVTYDQFLASKVLKAHPCGFDVEPSNLNVKLFPFQRDIVSWALRKGRAALFCDCGLGKTIMQLEWANQIDGRVLILAPLAVAQQTVREGKKFGIAVAYARASTWDRITVTNYEMLDRFDPSDYEGVVLDESSILKSFEGETRNEIIEAFSKTPYRLACTATPAPNDYMELGNHSEFLGALSRTEMLSTYFVHDGGETSKWRLKKHATKDFWKWVCSWAVMMRKPSDLGYSDDGFILPELRFHDFTVEAGKPLPGHLFAMPAATLEERRGARRESIEERALRIIEIVNSQSLAHNLRHEQAAEVHAEVVEQPPATCEGVPISDKGIAERTAARTVRNGGMAKGRSKKASKELASAQSNEAQVPEIEGSRSDIGRVSSGNEATEGEMRDLQLCETGQSELLSGSGPLPHEEDIPRATVHELQYGTRQVQRRANASFAGRTIPEKWIIWCGLNVEQDLLAKLFGDQCVSVFGSLESDEKTKRLMQWLDGDVPVLLSKPSIFGFGLNLQICHHVIFFGLSDSYEQFYQAVRRSWRFGQQNPVDCYIVTSMNEGAVTENIKRKERDAQNMAKEMVANMHEINAKEIRVTTKETKEKHKLQEREGRGWRMLLGDCVEAVKTMETDSIHYSIFSPPFASLYTYSASERDMGNCRTHSEFFEHFQFLTGELHRVMMPGRLLSFHCMNLPTSKQRDGVIGITDFRGELIRLFQSAGFIYHSEVCIWKDPVTAMQRTKALGLLHKQIKKDSCMSRQGIPDYVVTMRKPGDNPERVTHTNQSFPVSVWQKYASPVWMDINPSDTLQRESAREHEDERHICPLQLGVIRRAVELWSNPGDLVLSPFAGIGSEGYISIQMGRRFLGMELKKSYFEQACANLKAAEGTSCGLFEKNSSASA